MKRDDIILGQNTRFSTDTDKTQVNNNVLIIGGSGSGKTMSFVEPRMLETNDSSLIVTVTKRRIVDKYRPLFQQRGYCVLDLNFIHPEKSDVSYDPMAYVNSYNDILFLAQSIVLADPRKKDNRNSEPFWDNSAVSVLCALIVYVILTKQNPTFTDVLELLDTLSISQDYDSIETTLDDKFDDLKYPLFLDAQMANFGLSCWKTFRQLPMRTASCVYSSLTTTIDTIFTPDMREMMSNSKKLNYQKLATTKSVLFVSTSAVNPALNCFINTFYAQTFKQLFEFAQQQADGRLPIPIQIICDDFAAGCKVQNFTEYISIIREAQISVMLLIQSQSQLAAIYGEEGSETIMDNCDTLVFTGSMNLVTNKTFSERLNVPLEDVLYMPIGQVLIFRRGHHPIITKRYDIFHDSRHLEVETQYRKRLVSETSRQIAI